jgi:hypothetical protein
MKIFETPGVSCTKEALSLAVEAAQSHGLHTLVLPSTTGESALAAREAAGEAMTIIAVSHVHSFSAQHPDAMTLAMRRQLEEKGIHVVTAAHALSGAERSLSNRFHGVLPVEIMAHTLRMFSQGVKVAVEVSLMACDAGLVEPGEAVVALGGTGRGLDSALILRPQPTHRALDLRIDELLAKPIVY